MTPRTYPRTIESGTGERLTFLRRVPGPNGDRLEVENLVKPGAGPPMHVHHLEGEYLTVVRGRMGYQRPGEPPRFAGPGEGAAFPPGDPHKFWNAGDEDLVCAGYVEPAHNIEYYLSEIFASMRRNGARPSLFDIAYLSNRYRTEFAMVEIPVPVQRVLFPAVIAVGRLLGRYARYADSPPAAAAPR